MCSSLIYLSLCQPPPHLSFGNDIHSAHPSLLAHLIIALLTHPDHVPSFIVSSAFPILPVHQYGPGGVLWPYQGRLDIIRSTIDLLDIPNSSIIPSMWSIITGHTSGETDEVGRKFGSFLINLFCPLPRFDIMLSGHCCQDGQGQVEADEMVVMWVMLLATPSPCLSRTGKVNNEEI